MLIIAGAKYNSQCDLFVLTLPFNQRFDAPVTRMTALATATTTIDHRSDADAAWHIFVHTG